MGIQGRINHQPDYLELLKNRAYYNALIVKLTQEKEKYAQEVDSAQEVSEAGNIALRLLKAIQYQFKIKKNSNAE